MQPNTILKKSQSDFATIYIYRYDTGDVFTSIFLKTSPIYFGKKGDASTKPLKIAGLRNKHYFMMTLAPGVYTFDTRFMPGKLNLNVRTGVTYYLHLDRGNDCPAKEPSDYNVSNCEDRNASIKSVSDEQWHVERRGLLPINPKDVKVQNLVIIPSVSSPITSATGARTQ